MVVFSPLSLYTTFLGWQQYEVIFNALWQTGILYLGFLGIAGRFLKNVLAPQGSTHHAAEHALNHFLYELAVVFLICGIFVYPSVRLEQKGLSFTPLCVFGSNDVEPSTIHNTGTTYDEEFGDILSENVHIPLGFALLQNASSSLTYGLMKVTGCSDSLRSIKSDIISTHLPVSIKKQTVDFNRQCFLEARNQYLNQPMSVDRKTNIKQVMKDYGGENDLNWMGSEVLKRFYYSDIKATTPVEGFPYKQYPADNFENMAKDKTAKSYLPENGYPNCQEWWNKLKSDLVAASEKADRMDRHLGRFSVIDRVNKYRKKHRISWRTKITEEDFIARILLEDTDNLQVLSSDAMIGENNGEMATSISRALVNGGQRLKSWTSTPLKREATVQTLPSMQAYFYFFLIIITPIALALSGYSLKALGSISALFFMAIFIQCLWHYGSFLERATVDSLGENNIVDALQNTMVLFYYIAPVMLLKLSYHFGGDGGAALSGLIESSEKVQKETGKSGSDIAGHGIKLMGKMK